MTKRLNWERTNKNAIPSRVLSWKEERLDRAADNWIDHGSLSKKPAKSPPKPGQQKRK